MDVLNGSSDSWISTLYLESQLDLYHVCCRTVYKALLQQFHSLHHCLVGATVSQITLMQTQL